MTKISVAVIGAGETGMPMLRQLLKASFVRVVGVADLDARAPGMVMARAAEVPTTTDFRELANTAGAIDIIIDVAGAEQVRKDVRQILQDCGNTHTVVMHEAIAVLLLSLSAGKYIKPKHGKMDY